MDWTHWIIVALFVLIFASLALAAHYEGKAAKRRRTRDRGGHCRVIDE